MVYGDFNSVDSGIWSQQYFEEAYRLQKKQSLWINGNYEDYEGKKRQKNIIINDTLKVLQRQVLFKRSNYFLKYIKEYNYTTTQICYKMIGMSLLNMEHQIGSEYGYRKMVSLEKYQVLQINILNTIFMKMVNIQ